ncbi:MAG: hypothetical protein R8J94_11245 [Acidimicrobiia bacterium]|nr:hypothetical protein [Acidimicrobiia bacterium]
MRRLLSFLVMVVLVLTACGEGESIVEPGPGDPEETTTTSAPDEESDDDSDEVVTGGDEDEVDGTTTTQPPAATGQDADTTATTVVIDENSVNAAAYTELAASGLVLTLDEQSCADQSAAAAIEGGLDSVDAVITAVQDCASPRAIDAFASGLILAGGRPLPSTEAACVSSRLQSAEEYRPFWQALLEEEPFDFLLADLTVQNRYLELYAECVSVGRAVSEQANVELSPPTMGCIDDLYRDREFVRVTIEADLSGDVDERERIDGQISRCLTNDERAALGDG